MRLTPAVVALSLLLALAGCSDGGDGTRALDVSGAPATSTPSSTASTSTTDASSTSDDPTSTAPTTSSAPSTTSATKSSTPGGGSTTGTPKGAVPAEAPSHFSLPSGNIGCYLTTEFVRCDIGERDWTPPEPDVACELDHGHGVSLDRRGATFVCAGDTVLGAPEVLAYGQAVQRGRLRCDSATDGVTCRHLDTGAGFRLARAAWDFF